VTLRKNLLHLVRAAHERGIGIMPTMQYKSDEWKDKTAWANSREFVSDLVATIGKEPGVEIWTWRTSPNVANCLPRRMISCTWNTPCTWPKCSTNSIRSPRSR